MFLFTFTIICLFSTINSYYEDNIKARNHTFSVDYTQRTFVKDGRPFHYISGSFHYFRTPRFYWEDRLQKMHAAGLDAIQIYVPWNQHEVAPGVFDFEGDKDLAALFELAQENDLLVILRAGPYICAEWEFGGLPWWLLSGVAQPILRTMDTEYITAVDNWMNVLLPKVKSYLYAMGGPIIMVQVENEYGSYYACDHAYMSHLTTLFRKHLGPDVVLFTTDGNDASFLKCGAESTILPTTDFGPNDNITKAFEAITKWKPTAPLVNSEFYTGWFDSWGSGHAHSDTETVVKSLKDMLDLNASVNLYMFVGGTNFGYTSGSPDMYHPVTTSYDYDSPLSEAGDITEKYTAIRKLISHYKPVPGKVPPSTPKSAYPSLTLTMSHRLIDIWLQISSSVMWNDDPIPMERFMSQGYGFIIYSTRLQHDYKHVLLNLSTVRDRGTVMLDQHYIGTVDRLNTMNITLDALAHQVLSVIVENQGRIGFGTFINNNTKGIIGDVIFGQDVLKKWEIGHLELTKADQYIHTISAHRSNTSEGPVFLKGHFSITDTPNDTYVNFKADGWGKGQLFINGHNIGRYWPSKGPQLTLYVPACYLLKGVNKVTILELLPLTGVTYQLVFSDKPMFKASGESHVHTPPWVKIGMEHDQHKVPRVNPYVSPQENSHKQWL